MLLIAIICNLLIVYLLFRSPRVQTSIARYAASWLSEQLNTKVSLGGIDISWFLDVQLENISIADKKGNNIISSKSIRVDLNKLSLGRRFVEFNKVYIDEAGINLIKYSTDSNFNYSFIVDYFNGPPDTSTSARPWKARLKGIQLNGCSVVYANQHYEPVLSQMDYNNIKVTGVDLDAEDMSMRGDSITVRILNLAATEKAGFNLHRLAGMVTLKPKNLLIKDLHVMTPGSDIHADINFGFNTFDAFNHFIDSIAITASFKPSVLDLNEIRYFASEVGGMENLIHFNGLVKGRISSLKARNFHFAFGNNSSFDGEISMDGLPDINETFIHLKVKNLTTDYYDIGNIRLPGGKRIDIPEQIVNAGLIDIRGFFTGFINDFVSSADFTTAIGKLETDISLKTGKGILLDYKGQFNLTDWNLGKTFNLENKLGLVSISSTVNGEAINSKNNNVKLIANVQKVQLLGNEFNDIHINGQLINRLFNGDLVMMDELANLDFRGMVDFTDDIPAMDFTAVLKDAYLTKLNLWDRDSTSRISTRMKLNFKGSNIDNLLGHMMFDSTTYTEKDKVYFVNSIDLSTLQISGNTKKLALNSDLLDASFYGVISFADFYYSLTNIISAYLPSLELAKITETKVATDQLFDYSLEIKNAAPLTEIFVPDLEIQSTASLYGSYNSRNKTIILNGLADRFVYRGIRFSDWYVRGKNFGNSMQLSTGVSNIVFNTATEENSLGLENFALRTFMQGDTIKYSINWDDSSPKDHNTGVIKGFFSFSEFPGIHTKFEEFNLLVNDRPWNAVQLNDVVIDSTSVFIDNIEISSRNQKLRLSGKVSESAEDGLILAFEELDVSNADLLIGVRGVDFDGILTGDISLKDLYKSRQVEAQVQVKDFAFNKERMGDANVKSTWVQDIAALDVQADVIYKGNIGTHLPISAKGLIYPGKRDEGNFDLDVKVINYKLASLNPFLRGIASNIKGFASGNLRLEGTFNDPVITGELDLLRTQMKIDYLNVTYSFANKVKVEPQLISAKNVTVYDSLGNTASLDFALSHKHFRDIYLNMDIDARNLSSLYTTYKQNNLFYGNAFGSGKVNIQGTFEDISINVDASSEPNTMVYIPINLDVTASEKNFIRFKKPDVTEEQESSQYVPDESGVEVFMNMLVNPNAEMQLFLPENIGNIKGTGSGMMQMGISKQGDMSIYGDYRMEQGTFLFTLGNIINRSFTIQPGSTISFNGSPYDANINLNAVYKLKASLKSISTEYDKRSVPVDCIIKLRNDLYNPDISFSISLPQADEELRQAIFSTIDTTNQVVVTQQIISLLVLKSFSANASLGFASSVGSSSIEMLTDQLSNMLSQIIKDVDIGVKYRTGDDITQEEVEVALSTNLFNDRVSIDGNVGMFTQGTTAGASNIVGDVVVDVKITPDGRFRVKAFNRSNQYEVISMNESKYKQGIGIYYKYEFDRFSEIFTRKKKKAKESP